jgi:hypothetical protein
MYTVVFLILSLSWNELVSILTEIVYIFASVLFLSIFFPVLAIHQ